MSEAAKGRNLDDIIVAAVERNVQDATLRPCFVRLLRAIRKAENGRRGFEFGVESPRAEGFTNQAGWCASIVNRRWDEWTMIQAETQDGEPFLHYLARRYCPVNREVWLSNVVWFLANAKLQRATTR